MGNYLTSPNSVKHSENGELGRFRFGACAMQGWRIGMEDAHVHHYFEHLEPANTSAALFGIYDGHGGPQVATFVARHIADELLKLPDFRKGRFDAAFRNVYIQLDQLLMAESNQPELEHFMKIEGAAESINTTRINEVDPYPPAAGHTTAEEAAVYGRSSPSRASVDIPQCQQKTGFRSTMKIGSKKLYKKVHNTEKRGRKSDNCATTPSATPPAASKLTIPSIPFTSDMQAETATDGGPDNEKIEADFQKADSAEISPQLSEPQTISNSSSSNSSSKRALGISATTGRSFPLSLCILRKCYPFSLFSLQGIRSLFTGMIKLGSGGRTAQSPRGLAMLTGCTAVSLLVTESQLIVANAGDSRCVLCRGEVAIEMSKDHKPHLPEERARIYAAGGFLEMGRVNGNLNLSRALGDLIYKVNSSLPADRQIVSSVPDITYADLTEQDEFIVLGCDGIWESSSSQEVVDFIRERIEECVNLSDSLEALFEELLSPNPTLFEFGCDNMTAIVVDLRPDRRKKSKGSISSQKESFDKIASKAKQKVSITQPRKTSGAEVAPSPKHERLPIFTRAPLNVATSPNNLLPDHESFWESHEGSPFASDHRAMLLGSPTQNMASKDNFPPWEGVVAAMSTGLAASSQPKSGTQEDTKLQKLSSPKVASTESPKNSNQPNSKITHQPNSEFFPPLSPKHTTSHSNISKLKTRVAHKSSNATGQSGGTKKGLVQNDAKAAEEVNFSMPPLQMVSLHSSEGLFSSSQLLTRQSTSTSDGIVARQFLSNPSSVSSAQGRSQLPLQSIHHGSQKSESPRDSDEAQSSLPTIQESTTKLKSACSSSVHSVLTKPSLFHLPSHKTTLPLSSSEFATPQTESISEVLSGNKAFLASVNESAPSSPELKSDNFLYTDMGSVSTLTDTQSPTTPDSAKNGRNVNFKSRNTNAPEGVLSTSEGKEESTQGSDSQPVCVPVTAIKVSRNIPHD